MKVLFIASSVFIPDDKRKTVTGYDYIVSEIAQKLSEKCEIDLYLLRPYPSSCNASSEYCFTKRCTSPKVLQPKATNTRKYRMSGTSWISA